MFEGVTVLENARCQATVYTSALAYDDAGDWPA